jgi:hypothetical protein
MTQPIHSPTAPFQNDVVSELATLISSWFVRKDQKYFDAASPEQAFSKSDIERVSLNRLSHRFERDQLAAESLRDAFRRAIDDRHSIRAQSIPVWSGELVCRPGDNSRMIWRDGFVDLNTWHSPSYRSLATKVEPSLGVASEFFSWIMPNEVERRVFLDWLSWCLQHENDKPTWAPFFYSKTKGSGKSTLCELVSVLFGRKNTVVQNNLDKLVARFNMPVLLSKLVISEELKLKADSSQGNTLKTYITESVTVAERKGREAVRVEQACCFLFTTNHLPLWIEPDDRRYYVIDVGHQGHASGPMSKDFRAVVARLKQFIENEELVAALYRALMEWKQTPEFDAKSLNVETCSTEIMRRIHSASRQTTIDQMEELLNDLGQNAIPEAGVASLVREKLKSNVNSTKHIMSELGWSKTSVKWGGADYVRALWVRPGYSVEGGRLRGEDGSNISLTEHLESKADQIHGVF